jgi:hypothetical protein
MGLALIRELFFAEMKVVKSQSGNRVESERLERASAGLLLLSCVKMLVTGYNLVVHALSSLDKEL